jgi:hypothetical protein
MQRAKKILDEIGLGGERLDMFFMSGSQAQAYANAAQAMTERVRKLGPNPLKNAEGSKQKVVGVTEVEDEEIEYKGRGKKRG